MTSAPLGVERKAREQTVRRLFRAFRHSWPAEKSMLPGTQHSEETCQKMRRSQSKRSLLFQIRTVCENCGKESSLRRSIAQKRHFCSKQCANIGRRKHTSIPLIQIGARAYVRLSCQICEKIYYKYPAFAQKSKYCSRKCQAEAYRKFKTYAICPTCNKSFLVTNDNRKFCSVECFKTARPLKTCETCAGQFRPYHTKQSGRFCSRLCKGKASIGSSNPNYKGAEKVKYGFDWILVRNQALERDGYKCQVCFKDYGKMHVHHIVPYRICHSHRLDNLITLCRSCHKTYEVGLKLAARPSNHEEFLWAIYANRQQIAI